MRGGASPGRFGRLTRSRTDGSCPLAAHAVGLMLSRITRGSASAFTGSLLQRRAISRPTLVHRLSGRRVLKGLNSVTGRDRPQRGLRGPASSRTAILSPQYKHELLSPSVWELARQTAKLLALDRMGEMMVFCCKGWRERARSGIDELRRNAADARFGNWIITSVRSLRQARPLSRASHRPTPAPPFRVCESGGV